MRPYQIPKTKMWVDLDTIQSITEPRLEEARWPSIVLHWQHAFQDETSVCQWEQPNEPIPDEDVRRMFRVNEITKNENGEPTMLPVIYEEVFKPFFEAWSGTKL